MIIIKLIITTLLLVGYNDGVYIKDVSDIKIMFADHEDMAEAKLIENRDAPILREWEK